MEQNTRPWRLALAGLAAAGLMGVFLARLWQLQLVEGAKYHAQARGGTPYSFRVSPVRGRIFDANGAELASTRQVYDLELNQLLLEDRDLNRLLQTLLTQLEEVGQEWKDALPITTQRPYEFTGDCAALKEEIGLQQYATAPQVMAKLTERYGLENFTPRWQRLVAGVRRQMEREEYEDYKTYRLAQDLSPQAVAALKERGLAEGGVEIVSRTLRTYPSGSLASPILGWVGPITREDWAADDRALARAGYAMNEEIGRSGVEELCQEALRGTPGVRTITVSPTGQVLGDAVTTPAVSGLSPVLTLDSQLQAQVNDLLAQQIAALQKTKPRGEGREANAGAVVVLDLETGGVLAAASYPTYSLTDIRENYGSYLSQPGAPLFNRAFQGLYAPGSAFKPCVALAGLLTGTTTPTQRVNCTGTYRFYGDYQPGCLQISHGGPISLVNALKYSCNIYFYDLGRRLGVDAQAQTAQALGLGTDTGLELPQGEGSLTRTTDSNYSRGLVLQASIGQGNNAFTPIQLATYAATVAGHGSRMPTHILAGYYNEDAQTYQPAPAPQRVLALEDPVGAFDQVEAGMTAMAQTLRVLRELPFAIACKTGSPQRTEMYGSRHYTNTVMVAYGPVPDPKIAVAVVIEYGGGGANGAPLLAQVFRCCQGRYF